MKFGIEVFEENPGLAAAWGRCALLTNHASVNDKLISSWRILKEILQGNLVAFFSPQHGFFGTLQDNMIESPHDNHRQTSLPIYSLYSETREPEEWMLNGVDSILVDMQIVGCRVYTFKYTIAGCLRVAKRCAKKVVVFDRPNPIGSSKIEGRVLEKEAKSFVGEFEIPMRHGLTVGEIARYFNEEIGADLEVIPIIDWKAESTWKDLRREWVYTSPNLPTFDSVLIYPATVMLEGTNISEGRGTTLPFQLVGAPYIRDTQKLIASIYDLYGKSQPGFYLREVKFQPTAQKWVGTTCSGFQIHLQNPERVNTFDLGLAIIRAFIQEGKGEFGWKSPPYEYDYSTLPIKLILGSHRAVEKIEASAFDVADEFWREGIESFKSKITKHLLYPR